MENYQRKQGSQGVKKWAGLLTCQTIFLVLIGLVSISTNQAVAEPLSNATQPGETPEEELASLKLKLSSVLCRYSRLCNDYASLAHNCSATVTTRWTGRAAETVEALGKEVSRIGGVNSYFWIGLSDREIEGDWRWVDNTTLTNKFWNHWSSEPDNNLSGGVEGEDCVVLESNTQTWSDVPCEALGKEVSRIGGFNTYFWIGLSDREIEGDWRWVDNTTLTSKFWNHWSSEPDNNLSGGVEGEDCVVLESNTQTWSDVPCVFTYHHICQMDATPITCH
ncbi:unnamed protein product [Coregonus sp. 'balchen']|nr:unnamed protein product [Coregonus sp. 'balchen']